MSRRISLNARLMQDAEASAEIQVVLIEISHPDLDAPVRLSTDNTERVSEPPDIAYGTRSSWRGANPVSEPWLWIIASTVLPGDQEDAPAAATLVLENLDASMVQLLRSFTEPPEVAMAVVLASSPDEIEAEFDDLQIVSMDATAGEITLSISRELIEDEPFPSGRMSYARFPGLFAS